MISPADEIVQIVDQDDRPVAGVKRSIMRRQGLTYRASYILVFNSAQQLFIQKRTQTKDIYPGYWDAAAGGVVLAGEGYRQSAERELEEELGVRCSPLRFLFAHYHEAATNRVWGQVFTCIHEGPFILQEAEVAYGRFITIPELFALQKREPFTPDSIEIINRLLAETDFFQDK